MGIRPGARSLGPDRGSESGLASLVVADADSFVNVAYEDFAVADAAGAGGTEDGLNHFVLELVANHDFQLGFRDEVNGVFAAAVELGVAFLAAVSAGLEDGDAFNAGLNERGFDIVKFERLDNGFDS